MQLDTVFLFAYGPSIAHCSINKNTDYWSM